MEPPASAASLEVAAAAMAAINKKKSECGASVGRVARRVKLAASAETLAALAPVQDDVTAATRAEAWETAVDESVAVGAFAVQDIELAPKEPKEP